MIMNRMVIMMVRMVRGGEEELVDHLLMNTVIMMIIVAMRNGDKVDHNPMNTILGKRRRRLKVFTPSPHI